MISIIQKEVHSKLPIIWLIILRQKILAIFGMFIILLLDQVFLLGRLLLILFGVENLLDKIGLMVYQKLKLQKKIVGIINVILMVLILLNFSYRMMKDNFIIQMALLEMVLIQIKKNVLRVGIN